MKTRALGVFWSVFFSGKFRVACAVSSPRERASARSSEPRPEADPQLASSAMELFGAARLQGLQKNPSALGEGGDLFLREAPGERTNPSVGGYVFVFFCVCLV